MGFTDFFSDLFSTKLSDEERKSINLRIESYYSSFNALKTHYVTFNERDAFIERNEPLSLELKRIRVPKKDALYTVVHGFLENYKSLKDIITEGNKGFNTSESRRCDSLLSNIDGKSLDVQQRAVVICDEDRNLVLAGAGSGKTLTIAGKVKYLCLEKGIAPENILLIAFTKKSAEEMTTRISDRLGIPVHATTFHKLGLDIISDAEGKRPDVSDSLDEFVMEYFENSIVNDTKVIKSLIEYFAYYLDIPANLDNFDSLGEAYEYNKSADFETMRSKYDRAKYVDDEAANRREDKRTLNNERVKSLEEVSIANFLFLNGVKYEYERLYPFESDDPNYKAYRPDFYLPDYDIYIEHFGINREGKLPWLSPIEEKKYQEGIAWKREFHKQNGTTLLETYSNYSIEGCLLEKLEEILKNSGVEFHEPDFKDIFDSIYGNASDRYLSEFIRLCCTFLNLFKSNGYAYAELTQLKSKNPNYQKPFFIKRTELFKSIILPILMAYDEHLKENSAVDFSDMINKAATVVASGFGIHQYRWVIIDEYQDISVARYKLVKAILDRTGAKLLCVGDDWQSIYRFAGSDITLFTDFEKYFGSAEIMKIEQTYRNSQQLIDEAGAFVMKNPAQLKKHLRSGKSLEYPIVFMGYTSNPFAVLKRTMDKIIETAGSEGSILLLGRTNYDLEMVVESGLFTVSKSGEVKYKASKSTPITFMSP